MGYGIHALKGDGNNVGEVYNLTKEAISIIESGNGPVYMEFDTFRWLEHCGPSDDDHLGYRNEEEIKKWKERCPVKFQENLLIKKGIVDAQEINRLSLKLDKEIQEAVNYAKSSSFAKKELLFTTVYSN